MINEIWKNISGYEGLYQISDMGRVKSLKFSKEKILTQVLNSSGYLQITLCKKNFKKSLKRVHRLVAEAFISNPDNKPEVNHKKGIKTDNRVSELEWSTPSENVQHAFDIGLKIPYWLNKKGKKNNLSKIIYQYTLDNIFIKKWDCIMDVERELNINQGLLSKCANNKRKSAGGYVWSYIKKV